MVQTEAKAYAIRVVENHVGFGRQNPLGAQLADGRAVELRARCTAAIVIAPKRGVCSRPAELREPGHYGGRSRGRTGEAAIGVRVQVAATEVAARVNRVGYRLGSIEARRVVKEIEHVLVKGD